MLLAALQRPIESLTYFEDLQFLIANIQLTQHGRSSCSQSFRQNVSSGRNLASIIHSIPRSHGSNMTSDIRRENVYTFTDIENQLYTVTNVPDAFKLPPSIELYPIENKSFRQLLTPLYAIEQAPELPYLLRLPPINDPLLGRLCLESDTIRPVRRGDGWGLDSHLRKLWIQLEEGLGFVTDRLLLYRNALSASSVLRYESWPFPDTFGYTRTHRSESGASAAIRKARQAMIIMAARCSLALAVWHPQSPTPSSDVLPAWVPVLLKEGIPAVWIDALNSSVISEFSHGLRVGGIVDPGMCKWVHHLPVMKQAKIPVIVKWGSPASIRSLCEQYPLLRDFAPASAKDIELALSTPERAQARGIYKLHLQGVGLPHPFIRSLEERLRPKPPSGPFQIPGESRVDFLARMTQRKVQMASRENAAQNSRRLDREAYAASGRPPKPYTRVYLWSTLR